MKSAALIYNADAGSSGALSAEDVVLALHAAGYEAQYRPTKNEEDLDAALRDVPEVVFVAGGDGTVRGVAIRLAGRENVALGIIPMGTSNNVGATLGLSPRPAELLPTYADAGIRAFDVGKITAPWGDDLFIEAVGCGVFADVLAAYDPEANKSPLRAVQAVATTLPGYQPQPLALTLDGVAQPEAGLALLEIMNIRATGNSMKLATSADPFDGQLDVVQVDGEHRDGLLAYATALARDDFEALPSVQTDRARLIEIPYTGQTFHVDAEIRKPDGPAAPPAPGAVVRIELWPGALKLLLPASLGS